jgi:hypothetical protein
VRNADLAAPEVTTNALISCIADLAYTRGPADPQTEQPEDSETINSLELANRVDAIAAGIADLRINSLSEYIEGLREISRELRHVDSRNTSDLAAVRGLATKALALLSRLFDALGSKQGSQIIIAGAVAGIVGLGGWPTVSAYSLTLAVWQGPAAFKAALGKLPGMKVPRKRRGHSGDSLRSRR